jgi:hypothetical protein
MKAPTKTPVRRRQPNHVQALRDYLALGPSRSLEKISTLHRDSAGTTPVSLDTLKFWSRRHGWVGRAREHDAQVGALASAKAIEWDANDLASNAARLRRAGSLAADRAIEALGLVDVSRANVAMVATLLTAAADALRAARDLDGPERGQAGGTADDLSPDWVKRLQAHADQAKKPKPH